VEVFGGVEAGKTQGNRRGPSSPSNADGSSPWDKRNITAADVLFVATNTAAIPRATVVVKTLATHPDFLPTDDAVVVISFTRPSRFGPTKRPIDDPLKAFAPIVIEAF
jgi:hypothetical protein